MSNVLRNSLVARCMGAQVRSNGAGETQGAVLRPDYKSILSPLAPK